MEGERSREIICVQSGQAGVQLGHSLWELLTVEHGLDPTGRNLGEESSFRTFFSQTENLQNFPRALIFDSEPTVIDEIRCGYYRKLFNPELLINGYEDSANNFARGYYTQTKIMLHILIERVRHLVENCDHFQGFLVQSSTAGGTGSGLLSSLLEYLVIEFAGRTNIQLSVYPGKRLSNCIVQSYNCILSQEKIMYCSNLNLIVNNEELYTICSNQLAIKRPNFSNINRLICPLLSGLTGPIRFKGTLNNDLSDITTNLVPFPRLHFPFVSYSPLMSNDKSDHDLIDTESLTRSLFLKENQFVNADLQDGYFLASAILYRGNCNLSNTLKTIRDIKKDKNLHWVDWCPTGFKISHTLQMPVSIPKHSPKDNDKSAMMISNHNAIIPTLKSLESPYRVLLKRKAYLHWYFAEGMEQTEFDIALYETQTISDDYYNVVDHMLSDNESSTIVESSKSVEDNTKLKNDIEESKSQNIQVVEEKALFSINLKNDVSLNKFQSYETAEHLIMTASSSEVPNLSQDNVTSVIKEKEDLLFNKSHCNETNKYHIISNKESSQSKSEKEQQQNLMNYSDDYNEHFDLVYQSKNSKEKDDNKIKTLSNNAFNYEEIINLDQNTSHAMLTYSNESILCTKKNSNKFISESNNISNDIFEICEKNYIRNNFNIINKRRILRQNDVKEEKKSNHFIKKIYLKNKGILRKIRHIEEYQLFKSSLQ